MLIALDVDFHRAIYRLSGNPAIEEMVAPQWPAHAPLDGERACATDYRSSAWSEHEVIVRHILAGDAVAAEAAAQDHALRAGRTTEERLSAPNRAA